MITIREKSGISYKLDNGTRIEQPLIFCSSAIGNQGMIEFIKYNEEDGHTLYLWWDEGRFPSAFDTDFYRDGSARKRLRVMGVDEI